MPSTLGDDARWIDVSAPRSGVRNSHGVIVCAVPTSDSIAPPSFLPKLVLTTPGCSAFAVTPVPSSLRASSYACSTFASFDCAYAHIGMYRRVSCRSEKNPAAVVRVRTDVDDARRRARLQHVEQQVRQQEVREMVDADRHLEAVGGLAPLPVHGAGVVHQRIPALLR